MHLDESTLRLENGLPVVYRTWQPRGARPAENAILLLHGVESHSGWFCEVVSHLTGAGLAVYAPDRPGWGASPGPRGHLPSYDRDLELVERCAALMQRRHARIHLAGLSWGGKLALYAALRRPYLFQSLSLIAPGLVPRREPGLFAKARIAASILGGDGMARVRLPFRPEEFSAQSRWIDFIRSDSLRVREVTASFCLESLKIDRHLRERLGGLCTPVQLLLADRDRIVDSARTEELLAGSGALEKKTVRFEKTMHSLVFEAPERTARELAAWANGSHTTVREAKTVLVMGAGAVGSALGGLLARAGHETTLVARENHAEAVNHDGLELLFGRSRLHVRENLRAVTRAAEAQTPDLVLLCVKNFDTERALEELRPVLGPASVIASLQNGLNSEARIRELLPEANIVAGVVCGYYTFLRPGGVALASDKGGLALAPAEGSDPAHAALAAGILAESGLEVRLEEDARAMTWSKLMLNAAFNALNALTGLGTADLMSHPRLGALAVATFGECAAVMRAGGVEPVDLPGYPVRRLARAMRLPAFLARRLIAAATRNEAQGTSSMAQDLARGRGRSEVGEMNGAVVEAGERHGIETPANAHLLRLLQTALRDEALLRHFRQHPGDVADGWP